MWEKPGWDQRVEEEGLNRLGGMRAEEVMMRKSPPNSKRELRESGSVGEADVMLVGFWMRNGFRERLVTGLKKRVYDGKKAGGRTYRGWRPEGEMSQLQEVRKRAAWEPVHWERRYEEAGRSG